MKAILRFCVYVLTLGLATGMRPLAQTVIHVSPQGDDGAQGTAEAPLRSLVGARDKVRSIKQAKGGRMDGPITVLFADGVYPVDEAAELDERDSGTPEAPVVYRAAHPGKAVFSGGRELSWRLPAADDPCLALVPATNRSRVAVADLPAGLDLPGFRGGRNFANDCPVLLYAQGKMLPIAAWPDAATSWARLGDEFAQVRMDDDSLKARNAADGKCVSFGSDSANLSAWSKEPDAWAFGLWKEEWDDASSPVVAVDPVAGTVTIDRSFICYPPGKRGSYRMINCFSEMTCPGEWAVDRKNRRIYLLYKKSLGPVRASWARTAIRAKDVANVMFCGFRVEHVRGNALSFERCRSVTVQGCTVTACGGWGIVFAGGCDCRAEGNDLFHLGEGGIALSGGERATLTPSRSAAVNNHIHHYGERLWAYRPGVAIGGTDDVRSYRSVGCRVEHNLIHHARHMGVGFGGNDNYIGYNVIHDTCAWTCDAGAVYGYTEDDWSDMRGTVIEYNAVYMTGKAGYADMTDGIYLDGIVSGVTVRGNIVIRAAPGIFQNGGHANVYEKNVVACCPTPFQRHDLGGIISHTRPDSAAWKNLQAYRTVYEADPWATRFPELKRQAQMTNAAFAQHTLFTVVRDNVFAASGVPVHENLKLLAGYYEISNNLDNVIDPGFVDYAGFDWNLKPDSPGGKVVGRTRFDQMGLFDSSLRASKAVKFGADVTPVPPLAMPLKQARVRVDVTADRTFAPDSPMATNFVHCAPAGSWCAERNRICANLGTPDETGAWRTYSFSFTPCFSGPCTIHLMGEHGEKTRIDDIRATGVRLANGDFEEDGGWELTAPGAGAERRSDISRPYGIVAAGDGREAASGRRFAVVNHDLVMRQTIGVRAGVPVTVTFKAAAWKRGEK